jgi:putative transposase
MPNHFHLLIHADERSEVIVDDLSPIKKNTISEGLRISLSSYSKAINVQERRVGNLFQQRTKSKLLETRSVKMHSLNYIETCFHYIHYNPVKAGLVEFENEWGFSSFNEYFGKSVMKICDCELGNFCVDLKSYEKFYVPHLKEFSSY